jgi:hypothetical protein
LSRQCLAGADSAAELRRLQTSSRRELCGHSHDRLGRIAFAAKQKIVISRFAEVMVDAAVHGFDGLADVLGHDFLWYLRRDVLVGSMNMNGRH